MLHVTDAQEIFDLIRQCLNSGNYRIICAGNENQSHFLETVRSTCFPWPTNEAIIIYLPVPEDMENEEAYPRIWGAVGIFYKPRLPRAILQQYPDICAYTDNFWVLWGKTKPTKRWQEFFQKITGSAFSANPPGGLA